jgi:hypothetical protein
MSINAIVMIATASLGTQCVVLGLLALGFGYKRRLQYRKHGSIMSLAVAIHAFSIFLVMVPSFNVIINPAYVLPEPSRLIYVAGIVHAITGVAAFLLGLWLVVAWHFGSNIKGCIGRKRFMLATFTLWVTAIILGAFLFAVFYAPLL